MGNGSGKAVEITVKFVDANSNAPLYDSLITAAGTNLRQDTSDPTLWKGTVNVPNGGTTIEVVAVSPDKKEIKKTLKLLNKAGALKPLVMGVQPGSYVMVYDPEAHRIAKINLLNNLWTQYLQDPRLAGTEILFDFNSSVQHAYTTIEGSNAENKRLVAAGVADGIPAVFFAGTVPNPVNVTYDGTKKRVLVMTKDLNQNNFTLVGIPTGSGDGLDKANGGFSGGKLEADSFQNANYTTAWNVPSGTVTGTFKSFAYYRKGTTFLVADERVIDGAKKTVIQGFLEGSNGEASKKFEVTVGPDISNITVNNNSTSGTAYVAENKSAVMVSKLKAINLTTGTVADLGETKNGIAISHYSEIRIDNTNQKLYIGNAVSDTFYVVDLKTNVLSELPVTSSVPAGTTTDE